MDHACERIRAERNPKGGLELNYLPAVCRLFVVAMFVAAPVSLSLAEGSSLPYSEGGAMCPIF